MEKKLSSKECFALAMRLYHTIEAACEEISYERPIRLYGIPRGGIPVVYILLRYSYYDIVDKPEEADVLIDDIIDSGRTKAHYTNAYGKPFFALIDQSTFPLEERNWYVFPWETQKTEDSISDNIVRLLQYIGEDTMRPGLKETPARVAKAWKEMTSGMGKTLKDVIKAFPNDGYDEMVTVQKIPFSSTCEHHMLPFYGEAAVSYIPKERIIGLSKFPRLIEIYSKRLQTQERITSQVADDIMNELQPLGVGVRLIAQHQCIACRGVKISGIQTVTTALRGVYKEGPARHEFLNSVSP